MTTNARNAHNLNQAQLFDKEAPIFERPIPEDVRDRLQLIVEQSHLRPGHSVLDVGTGTGVLLPFILAQRPAQVSACDLSKEMLQRASQRFGDLVDFRQIDVVDIPPQREKFDVVFCNACFANMHDQVKTVRAIHHLLKPCGRLVISHPMGAAFIRQLKQHSNNLNLHEPPENEQSARIILEQRGMELVLYWDMPLLYLAIVQRSN